MQKYFIKDLIAFLVAAATALKGDGIELVVDPSADTDYITKEIASVYTVATALGEWYGDGQGEWAGGGQSILPPPEGREGFNGFEDSHGPWQQNLLTWIRLEELGETLETLKNAPRFKGLEMDEIRGLITEDPEQAAYAYLYTINIDRFAKKVQENPITEDMGIKVATKILDDIYTDWFSSKTGRGKSYDNVSDYYNTTTTTVPETTTTTTVPRPPKQDIDPPNRVFPQRPKVDKSSKKRVNQMLEAQINKQRKEMGYNALPLTLNESPPVQNKVSEELRKALELLRGNL